MKKLHLGDFDNYEVFGGVYHCFGNEIMKCFTSDSAMVYVPWNVTNAASIVSCISVLSKYFAIFPMSEMSMRHNILLDVTRKANLLQDEYFFDLISPPKLKVIQNEVARFSSAMSCPSQVTGLLLLLDKKFGLDNIDYVCFKVLGCHHSSYSSSKFDKGFGMTVGGFFFPCFENDDSFSKGRLVDNILMKEQYTDSKRSDTETSVPSSSESDIFYAVKHKRRKFPSFFHDDESDGDDSYGGYDNVSSLKDAEDVISVGDSSSSDENINNAVRPGRVVLDHVQEDNEIQLMPLISDDDTTESHGRHGR